jgi:hypothetical protein
LPQTRSAASSVATRPNIIFACRGSAPALRTTSRCCSGPYTPAGSAEPGSPGVNVMIF